MNDASSNNAATLEAKVTAAGAAIGEGVKSATAATAAAAGGAEKIVRDATASTAAAAAQAKKVLVDAGQAARQIRSQAGGVVGEVFDVGCRATQAISRQVRERPLMAVLVCLALGYFGGLSVRPGGRRASAADDKASA